MHVIWDAGIMIGNLYNGFMNIPESTDLHLTAECSGIVDQGLHHAGDGDRLTDADQVGIALIIYVRVARPVSTADLLHQVTDINLLCRFRVALPLQE